MVFRYYCHTAKDLKPVKAGIQEELNQCLQAKQLQLVSYKMIMVMHYGAEKTILNHEVCKVITDFTSSTSMYLLVIVVT